MPLFPFELVVDLVRALSEEEQTTEDQDQVAAGDLLAEDGKPRLCQADDPRERKEQQDAGDHGAEEPQAPRAWLLFLRQFPRENRDEDDVVDAKDDLEERQRQERNPDLRISQPVHNVCVLRVTRGLQTSRDGIGQTPYNSASQVNPSSLGGAIYPTSAD